MRQPAEKPGGKHFFFENGVKSKVGGCIGTACKKPETGAGEAMQPPKIGFSKKEKHHTSYEVQCFLGGEYRAVSNHGELLQSMHGALPAELSPSLVWH